LSWPRIGRVREKTRKTTHGNTGYVGGKKKIGRSPKSVSVEKKTEMRRRCEEERAGPSQQFRLAKSDVIMTETPSTPKTEIAEKATKPSSANEEAGMEMDPIEARKDDLEEEITAFLDLPSNP